MDKIKTIITHEKAPMYWGVILTLASAGFALGMPGEIGGIFTILGLAFYAFRKVWSK